MTVSIFWVVLEVEWHFTIEHVAFYYYFHSDCRVIPIPAYSSFGEALALNFPLRMLV